MAVEDIPDLPTDILAEVTRQDDVAAPHVDAHNAIAQALTDIRDEWAPAGLSRAYINFDAAGSFGTSLANLDFDAGSASNIDGDLFTFDDGTPDRVTVERDAVVAATLTGSTAGGSPAQDGYLEMALDSAGAYAYVDSYFVAGSPVPGASVTFFVPAGGLIQVGAAAASGTVTVGDVAASLILQQIR